MAKDQRPRNSKKSKEYEDLLNAEEYDPKPYLKLLDLYFEQNFRVLVEHHPESFEQFIESGIPSIIYKEHIIYEKVSEQHSIKYVLLFENGGLKPITWENEEILMYPLDAIQNNLTYNARYSCTITQLQIITNLEDKTKKEVKIISGPINDITIAKIPIMVKSRYCNLILAPSGEMARKHCPYDKGGYFIIKGNEKVILSIDEMKPNSPLVALRKEQSVNIYTIQVKSTKLNSFNTNIQMFMLKLKKDNAIFLAVSQFREISIFPLLRVLGLESDSDIFDVIVDSERDDKMANFLKSAMMNSSHGNNIKTKEESIEYLINNIKSARNYSETDPTIRDQQKKNHLNKILSDYLLPHVVSGTDNIEIDLKYKAYYICYLIHRLLERYLMDFGQPKDQLRGLDDRDSFYKKRIETPGVMLSKIFNLNFNKFMTECKKNFVSKKADDKKPISIIESTKSNIIELGMRQAISKGEFGGPNRKGLSQMYSRLNYIHSLGYMRRITSTSIDASTNKTTQPRQLNASSHGRICPLETPEGPKTGLVKNMAMMCQITPNLPHQLQVINDLLKGHITPLHKLKKSKIHNIFKIFVNGNWIGGIDVLKAFRLNSYLREKRFEGHIDRRVSLSMEIANKEFHIWTDSGRLYIPLLTVEDNVLLFEPKMLNGIKTWKEFLTKYPRVIEYIDIDEERTVTLADFPEKILHNHRIMMKKAPVDIEKIIKMNQTNHYGNNEYQTFTHCEIHPQMMFGVTSANIPYVNHNQSPRGVYQYSQMKHAMGLYSSDWRERIDISFILYHSQIPIISSWPSKYTGTHVFPMGENAMVLIASWLGYNQEDSIICNKTSLDKGLFRATLLKKYFEQVTKHQATGKTECFLRPDRSKIANMKDSNYDKLTEEGYPKEETRIVDGDVIIGKVTPKPTTEDDEKEYRDNSVVFKSTVPATIDRVFPGTDNDGYAIIKIRVRSERTPVIGDKFTSRASQKGTMGISLHRAFMPYTETGECPDFIINPNCMPKRMTIGHLIEGMHSHYCVFKGVYGEGMPFNHPDIEKMNAELIADGYGEYQYGLYTMYNGMTGQKITSKMFFTPTYYQRLKQMSADKIHARSTGQFQTLTRQPPEGKQRDGGMRFGEMERDAIGSHGAAQFLKEKLMDVSDPFEIHICNKCGKMAHKVKDHNYYFCRRCKNTSSIAKAIIPYVLKLIYQECTAINIDYAFITEESLLNRGISG